MENEEKTSPQTGGSKLSEEVLRHYTDAQNELDLRISDKERGFDVYDRLYRNFINKKKWSFRARVTDGRASSIINRKTDRLLANRMTGKMVRRGGGGTELGAKIQTELIHSQWNDIDTLTDEPMIIRVRKCDQSARKYGASFALVPWRTTKRFDGPSFEPLENRDVLIQPGARSIDDAEWVQVRRYVSLASLKRANELAKTGEVYSSEALEKLKESDSSENNYISINRSVIGISGNEGKRIELVTEYRRDRFITFVPKQGKEKGIILSDKENPYRHGEIPIVRLNYYPIDDDIYGLPELEAANSLIKTNWALMSQYLEGAQLDLYSPLMVNPRETQLDTIKFEKGARWLMEKPGESVRPYASGLQTLSRFRDTFGILTSLIMESVGETSQDVSQISQNVGTDKTATEVRDQAQLRTARDNANKTILKQFLSRVVYFWSEMNKQFLEDEKAIAIAGKEALQYFINKGLNGWELSTDGAKIVSDYALEKNMDYEVAYEELRAMGNLESYASPLFPSQDPSIPKLETDEDEKSGTLRIGREDVSEEYAYVPDVEAMSLNDDSTDTQAKVMIFDRIKQVESQLQQEGTKVKWQDLIESLGHSAKLKDPDQFFEKISPEELQEQQMQKQMAQTPQEAAAPEQSVMV